MNDIIIRKAINGGFILFNSEVDGTEIYTSENKLIKRVRELLVAGAGDAGTDPVEVAE